MGQELRLGHRLRQHAEEPGPKGGVGRAVAVHLIGWLLVGVRLRHRTENSAFPMGWEKDLQRHFFPHFALAHLPLGRLRPCQRAESGLHGVLYAGLIVRADFPCASLKQCLFHALNGIWGAIDGQAAQGVGQWVQHLGILQA